MKFNVVSESHVTPPPAPCCRAQHEVHPGDGRRHLRHWQGGRRLLTRGHTQALRGTRHIHQDRPLHQYR